MNGESIQIRIATADDLDDVKSCAHAAYSKYIERMDREPAPMLADFASQIALGRVYVASSGSLFGGYVVFYGERDHLHLESVAVVPAQAGKAIGKKLIEYVEQTARENGLYSVELYTNEAMTENLAMYAQLGYIETERIQQDGFNRVFFRKTVIM
jgi:ribosomal protein S18 acetylase RimI-like enzyme